MARPPGQSGSAPSPSHGRRPRPRRSARSARDGTRSVQARPLRGCRMRTNPPDSRHRPYGLPRGGHTSGSVRSFPPLAPARCYHVRDDQAAPPSTPSESCSAVDGAWVSSLLGMSPSPPCPPGDGQGGAPGNAALPGEDWEWAADGRIRGGGGAPQRQRYGDGERTRDGQPLIGAVVECPGAQHPCQTRMWCPEHPRSPSVVRPSSPATTRVQQGVRPRPVVGSHEFLGNLDDIGRIEAGWRSATTRSPRRIIAS